MPLTPTGQPYRKIAVYVPREDVNARTAKLSEARDLFEAAAKRVEIAMAYAGDVQLSNDHAQIAAINAVDALTKIAEATGGGK